MLVAAGDTFRAAAIEQLEVWCDRAGAEIIKQKQGSDPAAVAFDAVKAAVARKAGTVLIDTAGRLQTKTNLMEELKKIGRVIGRELPGAPHEVWLVLDATTGQNALSQAKIFGEAANSNRRGTGQTRQHRQRRGNRRHRGAARDSGALRGAGRRNRGFAGIRPA